MPLEVIGASNATQGIRVSNATQGILGRQMPPWDYRGVKGHTGVKVHEESKIGVSEIRGVKDQAGDQESKFGHQGSQRQMAGASKEMNPVLLWS
jgi:hypothetical protein